MLLQPGQAKLENVLRAECRSQPSSVHRKPHTSTYCACAGAVYSYLCLQTTSRAEPNKPGLPCIPMALGSYPVKPTMPIGMPIIPIPRHACLIVFFTNQAQQGRDIEVRCIRQKQHLLGKGPRFPACPWHSCPSYPNLGCAGTSYLSTMH